MNALILLGAEWALKFGLKAGAEWLELAKKKDVPLEEWQALYLRQHEDVESRVQRARERHQAWS